MLLTLKIVFILLSTSCVNCQEEESDYNYNYEYSYEDDNVTSGTLDPKSTLSILPSPDPEFRGKFTCSKTMMTIEIDRNLLPTGLGFAESISEDIVQEGKLEKISCIRVTHNETHYIYKVAMECERAVGILDYSSRIIYTHELDLEDIRLEASVKKKAYSVIIACETFSNTSRDTVQTWIPQYRVFEHREGEACSDEFCSLGELCLPSENVNGYFCSCSGLQNGCSCPEDFYACSLGETQLKILNNLICVRNDQLCDNKYDCPLQDDEECGNVRTPWSAWSTCSVSCGNGLQIRQRSCAYTFIPNPPVTSKECVGHDAPHTESRSCVHIGCTSVQCGAEEMILAIPLELGMRRESIQKRMHIEGNQDDEECRPKINSTQVFFVIPQHRCNTTTWVDGDLIIYSNAVVYENENQDTSIIVREYAHSYTAKCQYKRRQTVSLRRINANPGTEFHEVAVLKYGDVSSLNRNSLDVINHYSSGDGAFEYTMNIYEDSSYTRPYERDDYPLEKKLGERIYIAVDFHSQDEDLHVFIERCWATSGNETNDLNDQARYLFINGGCSVDSTVEFHNNFKSQFSDRYSIESFKFNDAEFWYIYFRCDVILCDASENDPACRRECNVQSKRRRRREAPISKRSYGRVMQGPIVVLEKEDITKSRHWESGISVGSVEHKIITFDDVQVQRSNLNTEINRSDVNIFESSYFVAAIVGSICLIVGVTLGLVARRRTTLTLTSNKADNADYKKDTDTKKDTENDTMLEIKSQS